MRRANLLPGIQRDLHKPTQRPASQQGSQNENTHPQYNAQHQSQLNSQSTNLHSRPQYPLHSQHQPPNAGFRKPLLSQQQHSSVLHSQQHHTAQPSTPLHDHNLNSQQQQQQQHQSASQVPNVLPHQFQPSQLQSSQQKQHQQQRSQHSHSHSHQYASTPRTPSGPNQSSQIEIYETQASQLFDDILRETLVTTLAHHSQSQTRNPSSQTQTQHSQSTFHSHPINSHNNSFDQTSHSTSRSTPAGGIGSQGRESRGNRGQESQSQVLLSGRQTDDNGQQTNNNDTLLNLSLRSQPAPSNSFLNLQAQGYTGSGGGTQSWNAMGDDFLSSPPQIKQQTIHPPQQAQGLPNQVVNQQSGKPVEKGISTSENVLEKLAEHQQQQQPRQQQLFSLDLEGEYDPNSLSTPAPHLAIQETMAPVGVLKKKKTEGILKSVLKPGPSYSNNPTNANHPLSSLDILSSPPTTPLGSKVSRAGESSEDVPPPTIHKAVKPKSNVTKNSFINNTNDTNQLSSETLPQSPPPSQLSSRSRITTISNASPEQSPLQFNQRKAGAGAGAGNSTNGGNAARGTPAFFISPASHFGATPMGFTPMGAFHGLGSKGIGALNKPLRAAKNNDYLSTGSFGNSDQHCYSSGRSGQNGAEKLETRLEEDFDDSSDDERSLQTAMNTHHNRVMQRSAAALKKSTSVKLGADMMRSGGKIQNQKNDKNDKNQQQNQQNLQLSKSGSIARPSTKPPKSLSSPRSTKSVKSSSKAGPLSSKSKAALKGTVVSSKNKAPGTLLSAKGNLQHAQDVPNGIKSVLSKPDSGLEDKSSVLDKSQSLLSSKVKGPSGKAKGSKGLTEQQQEKQQPQQQKEKQLQKEKEKEKEKQQQQTTTQLKPSKKRKKNSMGDDSDDEHDGGLDTQKNVSKNVSTSDKKSAKSGPQLDTATKPARLPARKPLPSRRRQNRRGRSNLDSSSEESDQSDSEDDSSISKNNARNKNKNRNSKNKQQLVQKSQNRSRRTSNLKYNSDSSNSSDDDSSESDNESDSDLEDDLSNLYIKPSASRSRPNSLTHQPTSRLNVQVDSAPGRLTQTDLMKIQDGKLYTDEEFELLLSNWDSFELKSLADMKGIDPFELQSKVDAGELDLEVLRKETAQMGLTSHLSTKRQITSISVQPLTDPQRKKSRMGDDSDEDDDEVEGGVSDKGGENGKSVLCAPASPTFHRPLTLQDIQHEAAKHDEALAYKLAFLRSPPATHQNFALGLSLPHEEGDWMVKYFQDIEAESYFAENGFHLYSESDSSDSDDEYVPGYGPSGRGARGRQGTGKGRGKKNAVGNYKKTSSNYIIPNHPIAALKARHFEEKLAVRYERNFAEAMNDQEEYRLILEKEKKISDAQKREIASLLAQDPNALTFQRVEDDFSDGEHGEGEDGGEKVKKGRGRKPKDPNAPKAARKPKDPNAPKPAPRVKKAVGGDNSGQAAKPIQLQSRARKGTNLLAAGSKSAAPRGPAVKDENGLDEALVAALRPQPVVKPNLLQGAKKMPPNSNPNDPATAASTALSNQKQRVDTGPSLLGIGGPVAPKGKKNQIQLDENGNPIVQGKRGQNGLKNGENDTENGPNSKPQSGKRGAKNAQPQLDVNGNPVDTGSRKKGEGKKGKGVVVLGADGLPLPPNPNLPPPQGPTKRKELEPVLNGDGDGDGGLVGGALKREIVNDEDNFNQNRYHHNDSRDHTTHNNSASFSSSSDVASASASQFASDSSLQVSKRAKNSEAALDERNPLVSLGMCVKAEEGSDSLRNQEEYEHLLSQLDESYHSQAQARSQQYQSQSQLQSQCEAQSQTLTQSTVQSSLGKLSLMFPGSEPEDECQDDDGNLYYRFGGKWFDTDGAEVDLE